MIGHLPYRSVRLPYTPKSTLPGNIRRSRIKDQLIGYSKRSKINVQPVICPTPAAIELYAMSIFVFIPKDLVKERAVE